MPIRIVRLDTYARTISVACPECGQAVDVSRENVAKLTDGIEIVGVCPHCQRQFDIPPTDLAELPWLDDP